MLKVRYNVALPESNGFRADALMGESVVEHKARISDLRALNAAIVALSKILVENEHYAAILLLDEPRISLDTLSSEWVLWELLFRPEVLERLSVAVFQGGEVTTVFGQLQAEEQEALPLVFDRLSNAQKASRRGRTADAFYDVLRVLLVQWFRREGPLQIKRIEALSGFSYPTIASALDKLEDSLTRHSDRSVELKSFPKDAWVKLVAVNHELRKPRAYKARNPKSLEQLAARLMEKPDESVAIGGTIGAKHYLPGIDLVGTPRLDLTVHNWNSTKIDRLARRIDPGLREVGLKEAPQLVVHSLLRKNPLFHQSDDRTFADEVECLLDLQEARLEQQALEFLDHLKKNARP